VSLDLFYELVLALLVVAAATWSVVARDSYSATVGFVSYGLLVALVWMQLQAVDVALTEVAIGSGLTGLLLLGAAARLRSAESRVVGRPPAGLRAVAALACVAVSVGLAATVLSLPRPTPSLAATAVAALPATGLGNPVNGVLMAFRAFDTLLEKVVLVLSLVGVWSLASDPGWAGRPRLLHPFADDGVLRFLARILPPLGLLFGLHLMWNGADEPGGAFQGATVLAAMWLLVLMAGLGEVPPVRAAWLRVAAVSGPATFLAVGFAGVALAGAFLAYPESHAKALILFVEVPMMLTVALVLALLVAGPPESGPGPGP
jgi:multisubunit Na+/H+ antiporter MnhB subunit